MEMFKKWEAERVERVEKRRQEEVVEKEWQEEQQRRLAAERWEDRERKLERARHVKAALEDNPDALRKGKWPRCTQQLYGLIVRSIHVLSCSRLLCVFLCNGLLIISLFVTYLKHRLLHV